MALLLDNEPPSSLKDDNKKNSNIGAQTNISALGANFAPTILKPFRAILSLFKKVYGYFLVVSQKVKSFLNTIVGNKYLPHFTIVVLFFVVIFANVNDRAKAYYLARDINSLDPNIELSITDSIDSFTPTISRDAVYAEKANMASSYSQGFASINAPIDTKITERTEPLPDNSKEQVYYVVRSGDTLSGLGWKFGVKLATLKYVNDLNVDSIKVGARLKIPVRGYEVSPTLIAKRENERNAKLAISSRNTVARNSASRGTVSSLPGSIKNAYPYGWCTYYVATRRAIPARWGNAGQWLNSAKRDGYATGSSPAVGAVVVTNESWWGHVAYVESVSGGNITISEMNAPIWGVATSRTISSSDRRIKGFIY